MNRIYFRGGRALANATVAALVQSLTGGSSQHADLARGVHTSMGFVALSDIHADFVRKARGEVGEDGQRWPRLAPATLAYGRKAPKGRGHAPGGKDGLLTKSQLKQWRKIYGGTLARLAASMPLAEAKTRAAKIAWARIKAAGGKTKIAEYADRPHEVLRDTGVLLNSLSPGQIGGDGVTASGSPTPSKPDQIFRTIENGVIVGTNVPYARTHNEGDPKRGVPKRQFLPKQAPQVWLDRWATSTSRAIGSALQLALARAGG